MRPIILCALPFVLAACATPQERCIAVASKDLRVVRALIVETEGNLDRGYAIGEETTPKMTMGFCSSQGVLATCMTTKSTTKRKAVAIDLTAEQAKLNGLRIKEKQLADRAVQASQKCQTDYP